MHACTHTHAHKPAGLLKDYFSTMNYKEKGNIMGVNRTVTKINIKAATHKMLVEPNRGPPYPTL